MHIWKIQKIKKYSECEIKFCKVMLTTAVLDVPCFTGKERPYCMVIKLERLIMRSLVSEWVKNSKAWQNDKSAVGLP